MGVIAREVIVYQPGGDTVIPQLRRNIAARMVTHKCPGTVRYRRCCPTSKRVVASLISVVSGTQAVLSSVAMPGTRPVSTPMLASWPRVRQGTDRDPGIGLEGDVPGGHKTIVEINIDAIGARRNLPAFSNPDRSATAAGSSAKKRGLK